ncbi:MAG: ABC transporter permease [Bacillota bacterium]
MKLPFQNPKAIQGLRTFSFSCAALLLALLCGAVIVAFSGYSPIGIYKVIFIDTLSSQSGIMLSLAQATPLMFTGMAFAIAYKVKLINLGEEGQLHLGAMAAALVGAYVTGLPHIPHVALALAAGIIAGGLVGLLSGILRTKFGANEIITSILLNSIITYFTSYLCNGPLRPEDSISPKTEAVLESARLTRLVPKTQVTTAILIAVVIAILLYILMNKTMLGYEMKVTGLNANAAKVHGINVPKIYLFTIALSGAIAGLCGAILALGVNGRYVEDISLNYGFAGISVAALASYEPLAVLLTSTIFGILKAGALTVDRTTNVPVELVSVVQAFVVVFIAAPKMVSSMFDGLTSLAFNKRKRSQGA